MPRYNRLGNLPHKRHTVFKKKDGGIHFEQLFGTIGFDGMSSLMYHLHPPTQVKELKGHIDVKPKIAVNHNIQMRALKGFNIESKADYLDARVPVLTNCDVTLYLASPKESNTD